MVKQSQHRGVFLLPNLFTTASLFAAFYSIVASMQHHYEVAVIAIFVGMIADTLDGRIARLTNTQTEFGAQYDSMSDMVTFGVAPSLLAYNWTLSSIGKVGWLVAFMYTASVALRLARFNTMVEEVDKRFFQGLACPAGAAVVSSLIWFASTIGINGQHIALPIALLMVLLALFMVSNMRYYSFKDLDFRGRVPFLYALLVVVVFAGIAAYPSLVLLLGFSIYALSGPAYTLYRIMQIRKRLRARK